MDLKQFQSEVQRNIDHSGDPLVLLLVFGCGAGGETGEVLDLIKKYAGHGKGLDLAHLLLELGDALWYITAIGDLCGFTLEDIMIANVEKLRERYPDGFTSAVPEPLPPVPPDWTVTPEKLAINHMVTVEEASVLMDVSEGDPLLLRVGLDATDKGYSMGKVLEILELLKSISLRSDSELNPAHAGNPLENFTQEEIDYAIDFAKPYTETTGIPEGWNFDHGIPLKEAVETYQKLSQSGLSVRDIYGVVKAYQEPETIKDLQQALSDLQDATTNTKPEALEDAPKPKRKGLWGRALGFLKGASINISRKW